jgi:hypothetical protein
MSTIRTRRATLQAYTVPAACLLAWVVSGCAGSTPTTTIVCGTCEEPGRVVRLQVSDSQTFLVGQEAFLHPLNISPKDWKPILASIRVHADLFFPMEETEQPAFTPEEVDYLSMTLSRAFAKAQPQEWVIFSLSQPNNAGGNDMTTGACFAEEDGLHLLLANYRVSIQMNNLRGVLFQNPLFEVQNSPQYEVVSTEYIGEAPKKSLLAILTGVTPHIIIAYQRLLISSRNSFHSKVEWAQSSVPP